MLYLELFLLIKGSSVRPVKWPPISDDFMVWKHSALLESAYQYTRIGFYKSNIPAPENNSPFSLSALLTCINAAQEICKIFELLTQRIGGHHPWTDVRLFHGI
jgi:hypothetical protein